MRILALEFSSLRRSVAIGDSVAGGVTPILEVVDEDSRSTGMSLVDRCLRETGVAPVGIDLLVIGLGPGSYAGIRSSIAIAQGWQLARDTRIIALSSIDGVAAEAQQKEIFGDVTVIVDAQRQELYAGSFRIEPSLLKPISPLELTTPDRLDRSRMLVGPAANSVPGTKLLYPSAPALVRLGYQRSDFVRGEDLEPIYLRETSFVKSPPPRFASI